MAEQWAQKVEPSPPHVLDGYALQKPAAFMPSEDEATARARTLTELVWDRVPKHLAKQVLRAEFKQLLSRFDWQTSFALIGPTGCGKSSACVHLVRELLRRGRDNGGVDFDRAKGIFWTRADALTQAGGSDEAHAHKLLHRAEFARLMILDDFATPSKTLLRIVQLRYDAQRPVIVTCGALDEQGFIDAVGGQAVARWILDCGGVRNGALLSAR